MPTASGDVTITISGKALETRSDAPEGVTEARDSGGTLIGHFHTSYPTNVDGAFGVRLDPSNATVDGSAPNQITGADSSAPSPVTMYDVYQSLSGGTGPGAIQFNSTLGAWFWSADGDSAAWPDVNTHGFGVNGGYLSLPLVFGGPNMWGSNVWGNQNGLPCTTIDTDLSADQTIPKRQGQYVYYTRAVDSRSYYVDTSAYPGLTTLQRADIASRANVNWIAPGPGATTFGNSDTRVASVNKYLAANLVLVTPDGLRRPNPYLAWNGQVIAGTGVIHPFAGTDYPVGSASFALTTKVSASVRFSASISTSGAMVGATVQIQALFGDGTYYTILSGTTDGSGNIAAANTDYWLGQSGPSIADIGVLRVIVTPVEGSISDGTLLHAEATDSTDTSGTGHYSITLGTSAATQTDLTSGNWFCSRPPITNYSITLRQAHPFTTPSKSASLSFDPMRRPAAALARTGGLSFETTQDAGHTYAGHIADTATDTADHSLVYDRRTGQPRLIYTTASTIKTRLASANGEISDWGTASALTGISGAYPVACEHPSLNGCVYLAYLDAGSLKLAASYSGGDPASWSAVSTIATGLDFSASGRAALVPVSGVVLLAVYASGSSLLVKSSSDGGATWGSAITIAASGPYSRMAGAGHLGQAAIMAMTGTSTLHLWVSGELGATWTAGTAPALPTDPAGLLWEPQTGVLRFGETLKSLDRGGAWIAA